MRMSLLMKMIKMEKENVSISYNLEKKLNSYQPKCSSLVSFKYLIIFKLSNL